MSPCPDHFFRASASSGHTSPKHPPCHQGYRTLREPFLSPVLHNLLDRAGRWGMHDFGRLRRNRLLFRMWNLGTVPRVSRTRHIQMLDHRPKWGGADGATHPSDLTWSPLCGLPCHQNRAMNGGRQGCAGTPRHQRECHFRRFPAHFIRGNPHGREALPRAH